MLSIDCICVSAVAHIVSPRILFEENNDKTSLQNNKNQLLLFIIGRWEKYEIISPDTISPNKRFHL